MDEGKFSHIHVDVLVKAWKIFSLPSFYDIFEGMENLLHSHSSDVENFDSRALHVVECGSIITIKAQIMRINVCKKLFHCRNACAARCTFLWCYVNHFRSRRVSNEKLDFQETFFQQFFSVLNIVSQMHKEFNSAFGIKKHCQANQQRKNKDSLIT